MLRYLLLCSILCGCALQARQPATVIVDDAHGGSSLVRIHPGEEMLASGAWDGTLSLWRLSDGAALASWRAHEPTVTGIVFPSADRIVTAGFDGTLAEWSLRGQLVRRASAGSPVTATAARVELNRMITGHDDGWVRQWNLASWELQDAWHGHGKRVKAVALSADGAMVASSASDGSVSLKLAGRDLVPLPPGPTDTWTLDFAPDGQVLMGAGWFRLHRWDIGGRSLTTLPTGHHGIIKSIQYSPDGRFLASISRQTDSDVLLLDPDTGVALQAFQKHALCGGDVTLSPSLRYMATTSDDASVRIYDLDTLPRLP